MFSPILCAGLLFGSAIKHSTSLARDYGTNLLGAMVGGVAEYLSLATGFRFLLLIVAAFYIAAVLTRRRATGRLPHDRARCHDHRLPALAGRKSPDGYKIAAGLEASSATCD